MSEGAKKYQVLGKFTPELVKSAEVGQAVVVKTVDENGVPTEWTTANIQTTEEVTALINDAITGAIGGSY